MELRCDKQWMVKCRFVLSCSTAALNSLKPSIKENTVWEIVWSTLFRLTILTSVRMMYASLAIPFGVTHLVNQTPSSKRPVSPQPVITVLRKDGNRSPCVLRCASQTFIFCCSACPFPFPFSRHPRVCLPSTRTPGYWKMPAWETVVSQSCSKWLFFLRELDHEFTSMWTEFVNKVLVWLRRVLRFVSSFFFFLWILIVATSNRGGRTASCRQLVSLRTASPCRLVSVVSCSAHHYYFSRLPHVVLIGSRAGLGIHHETEMVEVLILARHVPPSTVPW